MDIRNIGAGPSRPDQVQSHGVSDAAPIKEGGATPLPPQKEASDRLDLSPESVGEQAKSPEISYARKALLGMPPLSPERIDVVFDRIEQGYYSQPEVVREIAERLATELSAQDKG